MAKSPDGSSKMDYNNGEQRYDVEDAITNVLKELNSSLPRTDMDESAEHNSEENNMPSNRTASKEASDVTQEGAPRIASNAYSTTHVYMRKAGVGGHLSDETGYEFMTVTLENKPDDANCSLKLANEERTRAINLTQPEHSFSNESQHGIDAAHVSIQANGNRDAVPNSPAHPYNSINSSNISKTIIKQNIRKKSFLLNGTLKKKVHHCSICPKKFTQLGSLHSHIRTHTGVKPYQCQLCNKTFRRSGVLSHHMRTHTKEKPYKCHICLRAFAQPGTLQCHINAVHNKIKPFKCQVCTKTFSRPYDLKKHALVHMNDKPYKCMMCDANFAQSGNLEYHLRVHTKEKPFLCGYCGMEYISSQSLKYHEKHFHER